MNVQHLPFDESKPIEHWQFDSIEQLIAASIEKPNVAENAIYQADFCDINGKHPLEWFGVEKKSRSLFLADVRNGWPKGMERARGFIENIEVPPLSSIRRKRVKADQGDELDIDAVRAGNLDTAWTRTRKLSTSQPPMVHIAVNSTLRGNQDSDVLFWRGAAAVAMLSAINDAGYQTRCTMVEANGGGGVQSLTQVTIKDYLSPLDVTALMTACAHPAITRSLIYAVIVARSLDVNCGVGRTHSIPPKMAYRNNETSFEAGPDIESLQTAQEWIKSALSRFAQ